MTDSVDNLLQISGIQHFSFCRRQWALIHIEQQWVENLRTVEGTILHERTHNEGLSEKRGDLLTVRGLRVFSHTLGVSGICDLVEFKKAPNGITLFGREGKWLPYPVEYKRGKSKENDADRLQLCCQAMCLEEMLATSIVEAALYYGEPRRRERVEITLDLRNTVKSMLTEMHDYYRRGYTPKVKTGKFCRSCSMVNLCLPKLCKNISAQNYVKTKLHEDFS